MKTILILAALLLSGCRTVEYGDGTRTLRVSTLLMDTKIGRVEAKTADGYSLSIENFSVEEKAIDLAGQALNRLP